MNTNILVFHTTALQAEFEMYLEKMHEKNAIRKGIRPLDLYSKRNKRTRKSQEFLHTDTKKHINQSIET